MDDLLKRAIVAIVRPPLLALRWILGNIYRTFFSWWLDDRLVRRARNEFAAQVRQDLHSLFTEHNAQIIPNDREPPPYFDFAKATIAVEDLRLVLTRDRGTVHVAIAPASFPNDWQDFSALLRVMDGRDADYSRLPTIGSLIEARLPEIREALSEGQYAKTKQRLAHIYDDRFEQARRAEASINRRLYGP